MSPRSVPLVGVIGGIGSGKSSVADAAAVLLRGVRLDADGTGHRALEQSAIKRRLREVFGPAIFSPDGQVIRKALAALVFGDTSQALANRTQLNGIVHPWIRCQNLAAIHQHILEGDCSVILLDAAVLLESGWGDVCDVIAFIDAPLEQRLARVRSRGWDAAELARREASQLSLTEKKAKAHILIDNSGEVADSATQLAGELRSRFSLPPVLCSAPFDSGAALCSP